uniref:uncharacterized protein LOC131132407 n=1 Tax=Doryrhamphus excisus TaxID=161450 RepID=UPI0025AE69C3|nr:uncharacterized protein LOC131132407 [Doryrhamphus excisus]
MGVGGGGGGGGGSGSSKKPLLPTHQTFPDSDSSNPRHPRLCFSGNDSKYAQSSHKAKCCLGWNAAPPLIRPSTRTPARRGLETAQDEPLSQPRGRRTPISLSGQTGSRHGGSLSREVQASSSTRRTPRYSQASWETSSLQHVQGPPSPDWACPEHLTREASGRDAQATSAHEAILPQVEMFKYLGVLLKSEGRMEAMLAPCDIFTPTHPKRSRWVRAIPPPNTPDTRLLDPKDHSSSGCF